MYFFKNKELCINNGRVEKKSHFPTLQKYVFINMEPGVWYNCPVKKINWEGEDYYAVDKYEVSYKKEGSNSVVKTYDQTDVFQTEPSDVTYFIRKVGEENATILYLLNIKMDVPKVSQDNTLVFESRSTYDSEYNDWYPYPDRCCIYFDPHDVDHQYVVCTE